MQNIVSTSTAGRGGRIVVTGAGYAGLHVALRLTAKLRNNPVVEVTLVHRHDYHQVLTELPRVAGLTRPAPARAHPAAGRAGPGGPLRPDRDQWFGPARPAGAHRGGAEDRWTRLVLALGSLPYDFAIPGLAQRALSLYSAGDAERVWVVVNKALDAAAAATDPERQRRLATVVVGGGGATGVELAGELAEILPDVASGHGLAPDRPAVLLVEAGPTILASSSPQLIDNATRILSDFPGRAGPHQRDGRRRGRGGLPAQGRPAGGGRRVRLGGWGEGADLVVGSGLPIGHNGRVKVYRHLRVLDHPQILTIRPGRPCPRPGCPAHRQLLPPLAQVALEEGETVARNLDAEVLQGPPLEAFTFHDKGFVVSVGTRRGVADIAGITGSGRLAHLLGRRHRVGVPPVRHAPARLWPPTSPVTAARPPAAEQNFAPAGFVATRETETTH